MLLNKRNQTTFLSLSLYIYIYIYIYTLYRLVNDHMDIWFLRWYKTWIIPSSSCISTTVWMHHLESNEMLREKARCELNKNATCCFEQVLKATSHKTVGVWPLTSHLTNHARNINNMCLGTAGEVRKNSMSNVLLRTPTHKRASFGRPARVYIHQPCVDPGYSLEGLPGAMDDLDRWR